MQPTVPKGLLYLFCMKKVFLNLFITALVSAQLSCGGEQAANNAGEANANMRADIQQETTLPANVKVSETPLPEFTDANEAVAEGDKLFDANENEKAIEAYKQAVKLNPDFADAYFKLGIVYALVESEQEETATATEEKPAKTPARSKKGKKAAPVLETESDKAFDNAIKAYKKILEKNPKDDFAHFNLGRSYNKLNMDEEAEKALSEAVKLKPEDAEYQTELGAILVKLAHYEEAVGALKKALKIDANNPQAESLLEKAEAGRKRIDFGVDKLKKQMQQQQQQQQQVSQPQPKAPAQKRVIQANTSGNATNN